MRRIVLGALLVTLLAPASAVAGTWGSAAPLPGYTGTGSIVVNPRVGLAGNGDAAIAFAAGSVRVATRSAGTWSPLVTMPGIAARSVAMAMNDRGDVALVYLLGLDEVYLAYKPSDGPWQAPAFGAYADQNVLSGTTPAVAINQRGDAVVSWLHRPASTVRLRTSVYTRPPSGTGSWGAPETVDPANEHIGGLSSATKTSTPVGIDAAGNAIVAYYDDYATYLNASNFQQPLYGIRSARRPAGGGWSAPQDVTPRPFSGRPQTSPAPDLSVTPSFSIPALAADPASGQLIAGWIGGNVGTAANNVVWYTGGSVTGGVGGGSATSLALFPVAAAAQGRRLLGGDYQAGPTTADGRAAISLTKPGEGTLAPFSDLPGGAFDIGGGRSLELAVGGAGFAIAGTARNLWAATADVFASLPVDPWPAGFVVDPGVAANCRGDGIAAAYNSTVKLVYVVDYGSGDTAACGGASTTTAPPQPTGPGPTGSGAGGTSGPAGDTKPPTATIASSNRSLAVSSAGVVTYRIGPVDEDATGTIAVTSANVARSAKAKPKPVAIGRASFRVAKGRTKTVAVKLSKAARTALRRTGKLKVQAAIRLTDAAGNATTKRVTSTLKPARRPARRR